ncbi:MAG TPA: IMP dehydrogenase, partial [Acidimicrobiales bacterium]|nr:IMP dehydrogenase [Acidimicrobiales bacterium]
MIEVEIGAGKSGRLTYGLDEVSIVPSRRTRAAEDIDLSWQLDAFRLELPVMSSPTDSVTSPQVAARLSGLGALGVLDLEGLWTRYEDPGPQLAELAELGTMGPVDATERLRSIYAAPVRPELVSARIRELTATVEVACGAVTPKRAAELAPSLLEAQLDVLVIRGIVVSAEHVAKGTEPLNLKRFIRELDLPVVVGGCTSYQSALHLMRTGAVGVLVGEGGRGGMGVRSARSGATGAGQRAGERPGDGAPGGPVPGSGDVLGVGVPQATAIADAAGARSRHLEETGVYVQVIADGGVHDSAHLARAVACGADAVMLGDLLAAAREAPAGGVFFEPA